MRKTGFICLLCLLLFTGCGRTPAPEPSPRAETELATLTEPESTAPATEAEPTQAVPEPSPAGTYTAMSFAGQCGGLLRIDEDGAGSLTYQLSFYQYAPYMADAGKTMVIGSLSGAIDRDTLAFDGEMTLYAPLALEGSMTVTGERLTLEYQTPRLLEAREDVETGLEGERPYAALAGMDRAWFPTDFVRAASPRHALYQMPLLSGEIALPFSRLLTAEEADSLLGPPLEVETSDWYEGQEVSLRRYEGCTVTILHDLDGAFDDMVIALEATSDPWAPSVRDVGIGDTMADVIGRFLCEADWEKETASIAEAGISHDLPLYGMPWNNHDHGRIEYTGGVPTALCYASGQDFVTFELDENNRVSCIRYQVIW